MTATDLVSKRYDFLYLFDVKDGNPNGDPDFDNTPRFDPETFQGLVSDVCLKRKIRDYVFALKSQAGSVEQGYDIFVMQGHSLEERQKMPYEHLGLKVVQGDVEEGSRSSDSDVGGGKKSKKFKKEDLGTIRRARDWMCGNFYDVRAFGAVMNTTAFKCGQVRGPLQITFSRSYDRVLSSDHGITRVCQTNEKDQVEKGGSGTMGGKHTVAYGLYCAQGFVSPPLAKQTGFTQADLEVLWKALANMFDLDRSAARGQMAARNLFVFEHSSALGEAPAHKLFECVLVHKKSDVEAPRAYADYVVPSLEEIRKCIAKYPGVSVSDKINP